jgi:hypothetical protein
MAYELFGLIQTRMHFRQMAESVEHTARLNYFEEAAHDVERRVGEPLLELKGFDQSRAAFSQPFLYAFTRIVCVALLASRKSLCLADQLSQLRDGGTNLSLVGMGIGTKRQSDAVAGPDAGPGPLKDQVSP